MIAFRQIYNINSDIIKIQVPPEFQSRKVEIIILPVESSNEDDEQSLQDILLNGPTLTDEELTPFTEVKDWMNQWKISEF